MTLYDQTNQYLSQLPLLQAWPEMGSFVLGAASKEPHDWWLPVIGSEAVGGSQRVAIPAVASIAALQASIILIDDMLDADPRGYHHQIGQPAAANLASALQALSLQAIAHAPLPAPTQAAIMHSLGQMMCQTAHGQQLDVQNPQDEAGYWRVVATKSTPFFSTALFIGALCGGAEPKQAAIITEVGRLYGAMIQIHDDLHDTMAVPAGPDWLQSRSPLPILFAQTVPHPERATFMALRQQAANPEALHTAQEILLHCGAVSYAVDQIWRRYQKAQRLAESLPAPGPEKLGELLWRLMEPVQKLLEAAGGTPLVATANLPDQTRRPAVMESVAQECPGRGQPLSLPQGCEHPSVGRHWSTDSAR